ncbi:FtsB family cell division protein [Prevotella sp.]|uniref:FtsB family cell division protein n=1 Tax=Prevotella sp. TaxID=59823 RepID=UPI003AB242D3
MSRRLYPIWNFIGHNKYWIVVILGVLIVGFLDENSLLKHIQNRMLVSDLKEQIDTYNSQYERDEQQIKELRRNPKAITKIAREKYFMKADDEDIFVLSDDQKPITDNDETAK